MRDRYDSGTTELESALRHRWAWLTEQNPRTSLTRVRELILIELNQTLSEAETFHKSLHSKRTPTRVAPHR